MSSTVNDLHNFLRTRRSVRRFKPDPVPDTVIENILATATFAPSAHHRQPWRFVVITDTGVKAKLANAMSSEFERDLTQDNLPPAEIQTRIARSQARLLAAPVSVILCLDMTEMDTYPDKKRKQAEFRMAMQSVANAGLQLQLAAHAEGLGSVWVCSPLFVQATIQEVLALSKAWEPQALFFLGYPADIPQARARKPLTEITLKY